MVAYTERVPGIYPAKFVKLDTDFRLIDKETQEEVSRWRWVFQEVSDSSTMGEMDTITSPTLRARTNGLKLFTGMLGRAPRDGDDTDALVGQVFDVHYGPNTAGRNTVTGATKPVTKTKVEEPLSQVENGAEAGISGDTEGLPF